MLLHTRGKLLPTIAPKNCCIMEQVFLQHLVVTITKKCFVFPLKPIKRFFEPINDGQSHKGTASNLTFLFNGLKPPNKLITMVIPKTRPFDQRKYPSDLQSPNGWVSGMFSHTYINMCKKYIKKYIYRLSEGTCMSREVSRIVSIWFFHPLVKRVIFYRCSKKI